MLRSSLIYLLCLVGMAHNTRLFEDVPICDQKIIMKIQAVWDGNPPTNIISKIKDESPMALLYFTPELFRHGVLQGVRFNQKQFNVTYQDGNTKVTTFNWSEKDGVISDDSLVMYVLKQEIQVFAFYICNTQGLPGAPQGGVALALGPPGGIPDEAKTTALDCRETLKKLGVSDTKKLPIETYLLNIC